MVSVKLAKVLVLLVTLSLLTFLASSQGPAPSSGKSHQKKPKLTKDETGNPAVKPFSASAIADSQRHQDKSDNSESNTGSKPMLEYGQFVFSFFLVLATGAQVFLWFKTLKETEKANANAKSAADTARDGLALTKEVVTSTERAYMRFSKVTVVASHGATPDLDQKVTLKLRNAGRTLATITSVIVSTGVIAKGKEPEGPPNFFNAKPSSIGVAVTIPPDQDFIHFVLGSPVPVAIYDRLGFEWLQVVYGQLEYTDVFGNEYVLNFEQLCGKGDTGWPITTPGYNGETKKPKAQ